MDKWIDLPFFNDGTLETICNFLEKESNAGKTIYPQPEQVFKALELVAPEDVRVVILGQDPYPSAGDAHGLAFSVERAVNLPPSLRNIFKELKDDLDITADTGDLSAWAERGILLLNTSLTVEKGKPGSHQNLWHKVVEQIINRVNQNTHPIAFILWGQHASNFILSCQGNFNPNNFYHYSAHPSPYSAHKGFFGSKPFSVVNDFFLSRNEEPIDWNT